MRATTASMATGRTFADAAWLESLPGAQPAGPTESYDPETLSDRIDGKAELYLAANFQEMSIRAFKLPDGCKNQSSLWLRFRVNSDERVDGKAANSATGTNRMIYTSLKKKVN